MSSVDKIVVTIEDRASGALVETIQLVRGVQAQINLHAEIDAAAAELRAFVRRECETLRRSIAQRFRWQSVSRRP